MLPCFSTSFLPTACPSSSSSSSSSSASCQADQTARRERAARKRIDELKSLHLRLQQASHSSLRMHNPQSALAFRTQAVAVHRELHAWQTHLSDLHHYRTTHHPHNPSSLRTDPVVWFNVLIVILVATALASRTLPHDMPSVTHAFVMCVSAIVAAFSSFPSNPMSCTLRSVSVQSHPLVSSTPSHWSATVASEALRQKAAVASPELTYAMRQRR